MEGIRGNPNLLCLQHLLTVDGRSPKENPDARLVLMLGSSYTGNALNGSRVKRELTCELGTRCTVNNFGVPGAGPFVEMLYFERLLAAGIQPSLFLLEISPITISIHTEEAKRLPPERLEFSDLPRLDKCHYPPPRG